jgi:hypothetical protein
MISDFILLFLSEVDSPRISYKGKYVPQILWKLFSRRVEASRVVYSAE